MIGRLIQLTRTEDGLWKAIEAIIKEKRIIFLLSVCLICGCHSHVETHNITASESVRRVFSGEKKTDLLKQYSLVLFTTEENGPIRFYLNGSNGEILAIATIDKESYAAFFVKPGKYYFQMF